MSPQHKNTSPPSTLQPLFRTGVELQTTTGKITILQVDAYGVHLEIQEIIHVREIRSMTQWLSTLTQELNLGHRLRLFRDDALFLDVEIFTDVLKILPPSVLLHRDEIVITGTPKEDAR